MVDAPAPDGGGSGGFWSYINLGADSLRSVVDFRGMIVAIWRGSLLAVVSGIVGIVIATRQAFGELASVVETGVTNIVMTVGTIPAEIQAEAIAIASSDIEGTGVLALPLAFGSVLGPLLVVAAAFVLAWGVS